MTKWKRRLFSSTYTSENKTIRLITDNGGPCGIITYSENDLLVVTAWQYAPGGIEIWRSCIAQVAPSAGVPADLVITRVINDMREAFATAGKMALYVSESPGDFEIRSSDDWMRQKR